MKVPASLHEEVWCLRCTHLDGSGEEDAREGEGVEGKDEAGAPSGCRSLKVREESIG